MSILRRRLDLLKTFSSLLYIFVIPSMVILCLRAKNYFCEKFMERNQNSAKRFTTLLGKQLLQDATLETMPGVDKLRHSFQSGIDSLADGILKSELHNNFDVYFKQLQRNLSNKKKKVAKKKQKVESLSNTSTSLHERPSLVSGQLDQRLAEIQIIENFTQQCDHYIELLLASSANAEWQTMILRNWNELWNADVLPIEEAVRIANCCTVLITQEAAKLEWLRLCVKMFTNFVENAAVGREHSSKDNGHVRVKQLMLNCLYSNRPAACTTATDPVKHGLTREDLLSALLSLYTEYLLITGDNDHMTTVSNHVISLLYLLLGHSRLYYFDVILQITVDKLPHHSLPVLLSLCRYVVDKTADCHMEHQLYTKYLCCIITGHRISEQIQATDFKVKKLLPTPKRYVHWLCNSSPSLAKELNLKRFTTNDEVATIVIHSAIENTVEELLNLIDGSYVPEESVTPVKDDAIDDEVTLPVETVQASSPANVTGNGHLTDDETDHPMMNLCQDEVTDKDQIVDDHDHDESLSKQKKEASVLNEEQSDDVDITPTNKIKHKMFTKQSTTSQKRLSMSNKRRKRRTASLGFFVDTTPGHKDCVPPITAGIKKKRKSWKTPKSVRYYMQQ